MTPENEAELERLLALVQQAFGTPATPEAAIRLVLMAKAALTPLYELRLDEATVEWLLPGAIDGIERARNALDEVYDVFEQVVDDVGIVEGGFDPEALVDGQAGPRGLPR